MGLVAFPGQVAGVVVGVGDDSPVVGAVVAGHASAPLQVLRWADAPATRSLWRVAGVALSAPHQWQSQIKPGTWPGAERVMVNHPAGRLGARSTSI